MAALLRIVLLQLPKEFSQLLPGLPGLPAELLRDGDGQLATAQRPASHIANIALGNISAI